MNGMKPSSSSGSQSSFINPLASSLVNFSPEILGNNNVNCYWILSTFVVRLFSYYRDYFFLFIPICLLLVSVCAYLCCIGKRRTNGCPQVQLAIPLTEIGQQSEELVSKNGSIFVFVVQFQDFNEVMDATLVLGKFDLGENWVKIIDNHDFLTLFFHASNVIDGQKSGVKIAGPQEVSDVETIDLAISLEVIHIKGEFDLQQKEEHPAISI